MRRVSPRRVLGALPEPVLPLVRAVLACADEAGWAVHLVGGPVRDYLLQVPLRDVDLLVEGRDGQGAPELARAAVPPDARVVAHDRFGTARIERAAASVDLATTRRESYAHPGALPSVEPGELEQDLRRRDFTVNAMALPLSRAAAAGRPAVVDVAGGLDDLGARRLRVLHERSFHDDPTRALRAARLGPRLGFLATAATRAALRAALRDGAFGAVSGERLRREVEKLFDDVDLGLDPVRALRLLADWHVLAGLEPGLALPQPALAPLRRAGRALRSPPWPLDGPLRGWVPGLALWLAPLAPGLRRRALRRLAVEGDVARRIADYPSLCERLLRGLGRARGRGEIDQLLCGLDDEWLIALFASSAPSARRRVVRYAAEDRRRALPIRGDDLVALGLSGPDVGRALARLRAAFLDGAARTRDDVLTLAQELAQRSRRPRRRKR